MIDDAAVPQDASDSIDPGPPLINIFDDEPAIVRQATAIIEGEEEETQAGPSASRSTHLSTPPTQATAIGSWLCSAKTFDTSTTGKSGCVGTASGGCPTTLPMSSSWPRPSPSRMFEEVDSLLAEGNKASEYQAGKLAKWARTSRGAGHLRSMVTLSESDPLIAVLSTDFDQDPWLLGCENGTVDLRTGQLREPERTDLITKTTGIEFVPDAKAPQWEQFVSWAMLDRPELVPIPFS